VEALVVFQILMAALKAAVLVAFQGVQSAVLQVPLGVLKIDRAREQPGVHSVAQ